MKVFNWQWSPCSTTIKVKFGPTLSFSGESPTKVLQVSFGKDFVRDKQ